MKKLKLFIFTLLSVLTLGLFVVIGSKVEAATVKATWNVDAETDTSFNAKTEIEDKSFFKIETNSECSYSVLTNKDTAVADDDNSLTFTKGLVASGSSTSASKGIKVTTTENNVTVKFYYTMTDSKFTTTSQSKSGNLKISDGTNDLFTSSKTSNKANSTAYTDSYTLTSAGTIIAYSSSNRLTIFAISASYEAAGEGQTSIDFKYGESNLNTIVYNSGDTIDYIPVKENYTFKGWYTNSDLAEEHKLDSNYTVDGTITTLYAKFIENAKYTVTYYVDGVLNKTEENVYDGSSITYNPTFEDYGFDGWYTDSNFSSNSKIGNDYVVSGDVTLYGKKLSLSNYLDSNNMSVHSGGATTHFNNTIFSFVDKGTEIVVEENSGMKLPDGSTSAYRINKANSSAADNRLITFKAPFDGTLKVWAAAGNDEKNFYICDTTYSTSTYVSTKTNPAKNTLFEIKINIQQGKTYVIGGDSRFYIYGIFVYETTEFDSVTAETSAFQNTQKNSLRIVGTISGVTNTSSIKSIELVLLKGTEKTNLKNTKNQIFLTTGYTSITGVDGFEFGVVTNTYYVVFKITGITSSAMPNGTLISHRLIITFTDNSTLISDAVISTWNN